MRNGSVAPGSRSGCPGLPLYVKIFLPQTPKKNKKIYDLLRFSQFPTEFSIEIFDPETLSLKLSTLNGSRVSRASRDVFTRRKYARIRLVDTGVLTPDRNGQEPSPPALPAPPPVPFNLILEPLYLGVIPATVLPTILFLLPLTVLSSLAVPRVYAYLSTIAEKARREMQLKKEGVKDD
jgi:hypothetical protein